VQYEKGGEMSNFTVEKPDKHYLILEIKMNTTSNKPYYTRMLDVW
jgi:hypothetical protein